MIITTAFLYSIFGQNSGAKFAIFSVNTDDEVSGFAENDVIQSEADAVLDFTETNPFGMPLKTSLISAGKHGQMRFTLIIALSGYQAGLGVWAFP